MKLPFLLGRIIFGGFFIYNGLNHLRNREMMAGYAKSKNVPAPDLAVTASGVVLVLGGSSILLGIKPKWGAAAILGFLGGVSPMMHDFWRDEDANQKQSNLINFMKNLALAGGALALMGVEDPWPASVPALVQGDEDRESRIAA